jgi:hypothetical protein
LSQLKGADYDKLVEEIKPQLATLKKSSHGKQITAVSGLLFLGDLAGQMRRYLPASGL